MKFFTFFTSTFLVMLIWVASPSHAANEAQASIYDPLTGARAYTIPPHLFGPERSWFKTFQEGNMLSDGWQQISVDILAKTPERDRSAQRIALARLGMKIGLEWCRSNSERKVTTTMLREWGDILKATAKQNPQQLSRVIAMIDQEVDQALLH